MRLLVFLAAVLAISSAASAQQPLSFHVDQDSVPVIFTSLGQASAFVAGKDVLVSANHVLGRGGPATAWWRGWQSPVRRTCSVERTDLAVGSASVPQSARAIAVAGRDPQVGEVVMVSGYRAGEFVQVFLQVKELRDRIAVYDRFTGSTLEISPVIVMRYNGPMPMGMSGGPVVDGNGSAFAVMVAFDEEDRIMSAVPLSALRGRCPL